MTYFDDNAYPYLAQRKGKAMMLTESIQSYIDIPKPHNIGESINVTTAAWKVKGPHGGDHLFKFIQWAEVVEHAIIHQNIIRYYKDGDLRDDIKWGHDTVYAYKSCEYKEGKHNKPIWRTGLLGSHILRNELPCCGGQFKFIKECTGYCCVVFGMCDFCKASWSLTDGDVWCRED